MSDNPFGGMFGDIFSMLGQQGPDAWFTTATQLALNIARGEDSDPIHCQSNDNDSKSSHPSSRATSIHCSVSRSTRRWSR